MRICRVLALLSFLSVPPWVYAQDESGVVLGVYRMSSAYCKAELRHCGVTEVYVKKVEGFTVENGVQKSFGPTVTVDVHIKDEGRCNRPKEEFFLTLGAQNSPLSKRDTYDAAEFAQGATFLAKKVKAPDLTTGEQHVVDRLDMFWGNEVPTYSTSFAIGEQCNSYSVKYDPTISLNADMYLRLDGGRNVEDIRGGYCMEAFRHDETCVSFSAQ